MDIEYTSRGFALGKFKDNYDIDCSLQESSIMAEEGHVWFGLKKPELKYCIRYQGWTEVTEEQFKSMVPTNATDVLLASRMHLSQSKMQELLPALMYFTRNGILPDESDNETKQEMDGYRESVRSLRESV